MATCESSAKLPPTVRRREIATRLHSKNSTSFVEFVSDFVRFVGKKGTSAGAYLFFGALLEGIGLLLLVPLVSLVLGSGTGNPTIDHAMSSVTALIQVTSPFWQIFLLLCLFAVVLAVRAYVIMRRDLLLASFSVGFVEKHRVRIIQLLAQSSWDIVSRLRHGRITHVLGSDIEACGSAATMLLRSTVSASLLVGHIVLLVILSPTLALIVPVLLIVGGLAIRPVLRHARSVGHKLTEAKLDLVTSTTQFLGGLKLASSQGLQRSFVGQFESTAREAAMRNVEFARQYTGAQLALGAAGALIGGLLVLIGIGVINAAPAVIIPMLFLVGRMTGPLSQIQSAAQHISHSLPAYAKVKELQRELGSNATGSTASSPNLKPPLRGTIQFNNVSYWHEEPENFAGAAPGVFDLDIAIKQGSFIGLNGPSGAGKSTLSDLLVGLYSPKRGTITVAGEQLEGEVLARWRASLSYVVQDAFLFHDTVRNNLLWAREGSREDELWSALAFAGAEEFVRAADAQLDTVVGERGSLLSGGERQRIALARAMLRRPSLLVLDEATNAIDVRGETEILDRLYKLSPRPTVLIVAHRASSLDFCDRVLELRDGRMIS